MTKERILSPMRRLASRAGWMAFLTLAALMAAPLAPPQRAQEAPASSNVAVEVPTVESPINVPEALRPKAPLPAPEPPEVAAPAKPAASKKVARVRAGRKAPETVEASLPAADAPALEPAPAPAPAAPLAAAPLAPAPLPHREPAGAESSSGVEPSASEAGISVAADASTADWQAALLAWRAQREQEISAPNGWLTLAGLEWLKTGINSFGSAADNSIRIHAQVPEHLGLLTVIGAELPGKAHAAKGKAAVETSPEIVQLLAPRDGFPAGLELDGAPAREGPLDVDSQKPSTLTWKGLTMVVISRGGRYMLRIKDADAPARASFTGLKWFSPDPRYRVTARWIPFMPPHIEKIPTVIGTTLDLPAPGVAEFELDGKTLRLEPVIEASEPDRLFFILRDTTSKATTYGGGRFLHTPLPDHGVSAAGTLTLDFNQLYNPPCAYTPYATCPLPPEQNRLAVSIEAGEQRYSH